MATAANLDLLQPQGFFTRSLADADAAVAKAIGEEPRMKYPARFAQRLAERLDIVGAGLADHVGFLEAVAADVEEITWHG